MNNNIFTENDMKRAFVEGASLLTSPLKNRLDRAFQKWIDITYNRGDVMSVLGLKRIIERESIEQAEYEIGALITSRMRERLYALSVIYPNEKIRIYDSGIEINIDLEWVNIMDVNI